MSSAQAKVTATLFKGYRSRSKDRDCSAPAITYLTVQPSPLSVSLTTRTADFELSDMVNLNMTASRDPDVVATNTSGIRLEVFCYPESAADIYEKMTAEQMHTTANSIVNNR